MSTDLVDDRMLGALHLRLLNRAGFEHDPIAEHTAFQAGTLDGLMAGGFDGDVSIAEVLAHGTLGIGTIEHLGGELVIIDGTPFVIDGDGTVDEVGGDTLTPFAVVCRFSPLIEAEAVDIDGFEALRAVLDDLGRDAEFLAIRIDGEFTNLKLRSVHAQRPPYVSLAEVTRHQTEWSLDQGVGSLVGFRFPDTVAGIEVPGYHLHYIADDRSAGGHLLNATIKRARISLDVGNELHVEVPAGLAIGEPGAADRMAIRAVEGG